MPLLRKKTLERPNDVLEMLKDDDEVFFCEITNELFRDYEEYCERIILVNSMVWSCSMTGKSNLTYAEALKSEEDATRKLKKFPPELRGPILYLASQTKRKNLGDMLEDVFLYAKDKYFVGEKVLVPSDEEFGEARIVKVNEVITDGTKSYTYDVKILPIKPDSKIITLNSEHIQRKKSSYNRPKNKLFLKQYVEQADGIFRIKESILKKYNIHEMKFSDIFVGEKPIFGSSMKASKADLNSSLKHQKQESIAKYFSKVDGSQAAYNMANGDSKGLKDKPFAHKKSSEEIKQKILEDKKMLKEERQIAKMNVKDMETRMHKFLRQWHAVKEDLELTDQRAIPSPIPIDAFIPNKLVGDFITLLEFLETFQKELHVKESFPHGVSWDTFERALTLKEINGPLHDIFQLLLGYIFDCLAEEYAADGNARPVPALFSTAKENTLPWYVDCATAAWRYANMQFGSSLIKKRMDAVTLSELLRLHLLSSGAKVKDNLAKLRYSTRGGYDSTDDPGLQLRITQPHILKALSMYNLCQMPRRDILKLLMCLMDQILTYTPIRDLVEKRLEASAKAKLDLKNLQATHRKTEAEYTANKQKYTKDMQLSSTKSRENSAALEAFEKEHQAYMQKYTEECDELLRIQFSHEIYLGSDRCYRRYWLFESVPGLFVEDHEPNAGPCLTNIVQQHPVLSTCEPGAYITKLKAIFREHHRSTHDKENNDISIISKIVNNNTVIDTETLHSKALELNMCTADNKSCKIHGDVEKTRWSFFYTKEQVDALMASLNKRGVREKYLLNNLKQWKELIYDHIENCPLDKLTKHLAPTKNLRPKLKYNMNDINLNHTPGTDPEVILKDTLGEFILEFYEKLESGFLAKLNVEKYKVWADALRNGEYDMQCDEICWGRTHDNKMFVKKRDGEIMMVVVTAKEDSKSEQGDDDDNGDDDDEDDEEYTVVDGAIQGFYDPGSTLGATMEIESEDSDEETFVLHESSSMKQDLNNLASALLQVAQSIHKSNLHRPLGPVAKKVDKRGNFNINEHKSRRMFRIWEVSLMNCTSYGQILSHYHALEQCVIWNNAITNSRCKVCNRKTKPSTLLICDKCNAMVHMDCTNPALKEIPDGDWFCNDCSVPVADKDKNSNRSKRAAIKKNQEEDEPSKKKRRNAAHETNGVDSESDSEKELPNGVHNDRQTKLKNNKRTSSLSTASSLVPLCDACRSGGELISCCVCSTSWHIECIKPAMRRTPRGKWACSQCSSKTSNGTKRSLDTTANQDDEYHQQSSRRSANACRKRILNYAHMINDEDQHSSESDSSLSSDNEQSFAITPVRKSKKKESIVNDSLNASANYPFPQYKQIEGLLTDIAKHRDSWPFMAPVTLEEVPDYFEIISKPMDFGTIRDRLKAGDYKDVKEVVEDMSLVFENCDTYNNGESDVFKAGTRLLKFILKKSQDWNLDFPQSIIDAFIE